ncbi:unnamed protein product [Sphenostylis stenocarpa]|uniref:Uncharacterized protein n=1 Tax=Sphenostylis stenocarpa TaxID=92480 RepID=A0AA86S4B9_9FABA|nr:unnamed protein product [Sphenostylis stenocarpa]
MTTEWKTVALFPIPSVIYLIHNNVQFATLTYVDTFTYRIMGNLKIVTAGVGGFLTCSGWLLCYWSVGTTTSRVPRKLCLTNLVLCLLNFVYKKLSTVLYALFDMDNELKIGVEELDEYLVQTFVRVVQAVMQ